MPLIIIVAAHAAMADVPPFGTYSMHMTNRREQFKFHGERVPSCGKSLWEALQRMQSIHIEYTGGVLVNHEEWVHDKDMIVVGDDYTQTSIVAHHPDERKQRLEVTFWMQESGAVRGNLQFIRSDAHGVPVCVDGAAIFGSYQK